MTDTITLLKDRLHKAESKVSRYEKTLETAKNELLDIQTTLRVLGEISGESHSESPIQGHSSVGERQLQILALIPEGQSKAAQPVALYDLFKVLYGEVVNIDTFRTTIWRMKERQFEHSGTVWFVSSDNGRYWKVPMAEENETPEAKATSVSEVSG